MSFSDILVVLVIVLIFSPVYQEEDYKRCQDAFAVVGETARVTYSVFSKFHKSDRISYYLIRESDPNTRILYDFGKLTVNDKNVTTNGVVDGKLEVQIPNVTTKFRGKYILQTYLNGAVDTAYYIFLDVRPKNKTTTSDKETEDNDENFTTPLIASLVTLFVVGVLVIIGVICYTRRWRKCKCNHGYTSPSEQMRDEDL